MKTAIEKTRELLEAVKISCLTEGIRLSTAALAVLSKGGTETLSIHEYPTTGGVTLVLDGDVYVNAPFDEWFCDDARAVLEVGDEGLTIEFDGVSLPVGSVLPLPGYVGQPAAGVAMSHADRVRLSPLVGCAYDCGFCDLGAMQYEIRSERRLLAALEVAARDTVLPPRHVLISGGSPRRAHYETFIAICEAVIRGSSMPVDVMFSPMIENLTIVDRLVEAGAAGFAINIEIFAEGPATAALGRKYRTTRGAFEATVSRAVELLGSRGRVRSLILAGLESPEQTLEGVEYLASLGVDPVLSPFRPASDIRLGFHRPPRSEDLQAILDESRSIVSRHGVALGPDCVPCQHNTLSFPWDVRTASSEVGTESA